MRTTTDRMADVALNAIDARDKEIADLRAQLEAAEQEILKINRAREVGIKLYKTWERAATNIANELRLAKQERDNLQIKLNQVSDQWKDSQHEIKLLNMALRAANNGNDTDDLRYSYEPGRGVEQLKTVCNGVIVHIPVDWFTEIIDELTTKNNNLQAAYGVLRDTIKAIREDIIYHNQVRFAGGEIFNLITPETAGKVEKAFHSTPAEAGERVRGLVTALDHIAHSDISAWEFRKLATDALAKFRGGANNANT